MYGLFLAGLFRSDDIRDKLILGSPDFVLKVRERSHRERQQPRGGGFEMLTRGWEGV